MEKLNRLGWAGGGSYVSFGVRFGVRTTDPSVMPQIEARLPPGTRLSRSEFTDELYSLKVGGGTSQRGLRVYHLLYCGLLRIARSTDLESVFEAFEQDLQLFVAEKSRQKLFVHAGVVGYNGQAILVPGRTMSGKSTLVAALVRAGATYYSDEYAVLDAEGRVHPYLKTISLRREDGEPPDRVRAEDLGGRSGTKPLPVGLVAISKFREGARWQPQTLSRGKAVLALLSNTVPARRRPDSALCLLRKVVTHAPVINGTRGEADEAARIILDRVSSLPAQSP